MYGFPHIHLGLKDYLLYTIFPSAGDLYGVGADKSWSLSVQAEPSSRGSNTHKLTHYIMFVKFPKQKRAPKIARPFQKCQADYN